MPYPNEHACRLREPIKDAETRRTNGDREHNGKKYDVIYQKQDDGKWADQAFRYPKKTWSASEASDHCKSHNGRFEAASEKKDEAVQFINEVLNQPIFITAAGYATLVSMAFGHEPVPDIDNQRYSDGVQIYQNIESLDGDCISVISIQGPLVRRSSYISNLYNLESYDMIQTAFLQALDDPLSKAIIFDINSPGGQSAGLFDLADLIYSSRGKKPICASANIYAFSAAYAIASATDHITLSRDGGVGSVGVIMQHIDYSEMLKNWGLKVTSIYAGKRKNDFSPYYPLSDEAKARAQQMVDEHYQEFVHIIGRNRNMSAEDVIKTEADIYFGKKAVGIGFADEVLSYEDTINRTAKLVRGVALHASDERWTNFEEGLVRAKKAFQIKVQRFFGAKGKEKDMNKEAMISELISKGEYPFTESDRVWLGSLDETRLAEFLSMVSVDGSTDVIEDRIRASLEPKIRAEIRAELEGADNQVLEMMRSEIDVLRTEVRVAKDKAQNEEDLRLRSEFRIFVVDNHIPGDSNKLVETMLSLKKTNEEAFKSYQDTLHAAGEAMKAAGVFGEIGSRNALDTVASAYVRLQEKKVEIMKSNPSMTESQAWRNAIRDNPELYKEYTISRKEVA